jgi:hypothetical protein
MLQYMYNLITLLCFDNKKNCICYINAQSSWSKSFSYILGICLRSVSIKIDFFFLYYLIFIGFTFSGNIGNSIQYFVLMFVCVFMLVSSYY